MKLVHPLFPAPIVFSEDKICVLIMENAPELRRMVDQLRAQCAGDAGDFVLSEGAELLELSRLCGFVSDPTAMELNSRRIQTKLDQSALEAGAAYEEAFREILLRLNEIAAGIVYAWILTRLIPSRIPGSR